MHVIYNKGVKLESLGVCEGMHCKQVTKVDRIPNKDTGYIRKSENIGFPHISHYCKM